METLSQGELAAQIAELREMPITQLSERYAQAFGAKPPVVYRQYLVRRVAWKMQAMALGGLSEPAAGRALEIAKEIRFEDTDSLAVETRRSTGDRRSRKHRDKRQTGARLGADAHI